jgi:hypothetical protein
VLYSYFALTVVTVSLHVSLLDQGDDRIASARKALDHLTAGKEINW